MTYKSIAAAILASSVLLAGCVGSSTSDLEAFVRSVDQRPAGPIPPLPEFPEPVAYQYSSVKKRSPFEPKQTVAALVQQLQSEGVSPDATRTRQPLEGFRVENLKMVGTISTEGSSLKALIMDPSGLIHTLSRGSYMGQNNGKIVGIGQGRIDLMEIVSNGQGGWLERPRVISMAEVK